MESQGIVRKNIKRDALPTSVLWNSDELGHKVEMQFRLALPISILVLSVLALPLSHTSPRKGRFSKMPLGIFIYLVYANSVVVGVNWMEKGKIPEWLGVWWIHLLVLSVALYIVYKRNGINLFKKNSRATA